MNSRNSISKKKNSPSNREDDETEVSNITLISDKNGKTRKKRDVITKLRSNSL